MRVLFQKSSPGGWRPSLGWHPEAVLPFAFTPLSVCLKGNHFHYLYTKGQRTRLQCV